MLVTDAGMPSVSDPGFRLVAAAVEAGVTVTVVPGPSAVLAALAVSGLPVDRFCFEGFLPRKAGERSARLRSLAAEPRTLVFFEAPHRLAATLTAMAEAFGAGRRAAVCRELTKTYEEVRRVLLDELVSWVGDEFGGEATSLSPARSRPNRVGVASRPSWRAGWRPGEEAGEPRKEAIAAVAEQSGVPKRTVFDAVVAAKSVRT